MTSLTFVGYNLVFAATSQSACALLLHLRVKTDRSHGDDEPHTVYYNVKDSWRGGRYDLILPRTMTTVRGIVTILVAYDATTRRVIARLNARHRTLETYRKDGVAKRP